MAHRSCPDCGAHIVLSAAFCKCCGCRIANALVACSQCDALVPVHSTACPHCESSLSDTTVTQPQQSTAIIVEEQLLVSPSATPSQSKRERKEHQRQWRLVGATFIVILMLVIGGYGYLEYRKSEGETLDYATAVEQRDLALCERFLVQYPKSHRIAEVRTLIAQLKAEKQAWDKAKRTDNISAYEAFMKTYPQAHAIHECQEAIDSITWHRGDFQLVRSRLEQYIAQTTHPRYNQWAKDVLSRYNADGVSTTETSEINQALMRFFEALGTAKMEAPTRYVHLPLTRFFGSQMAQEEQVQAYSHRLRKEHATFVYKALTSIRKEHLADGGFRYVVLCSVERVVRGSRRGYITYIHLTPHYKLKSIGFMHTTTSDDDMAVAEEGTDEVMTTSVEEITQ